MSFTGWGDLVFRIGTTSYIIPADILPNVEFLADKVDDIQLVLFETDEYGSNLPDAALRTRLREIASRTGLTYSVHLPLDLRLADDGAASHVSLVKAQRVIAATQELEPSAYTVHLDGAALLIDPGADALARWQEQARQSLATVASWLPDPGLLCVENLERWDPDAFAPVIAALPVSRTIDVGHFWLMHQDPLPHLRRWLPRTRMIHLHGVAERDHASLALVPANDLAAVAALLAAEFSGVVTLEVFNEADLQSSLAALEGALPAMAADPAKRISF